MWWEIQINHKIHFITKQPLRERPTLILTLSKKGLVLNELFYGSDRKNTFHLQLASFNLERKN